MSLKKIQQDIKDGSFRPIYYFCGTEPYLKRFYLNSLISAILPYGTETDLHRYEGKELESDVFSEELWLCPLGERKILLISDLPASSSVAAFLSGDDCEIAEDTTVIIYQQTENPDSRTKAFKDLKARIVKDGLYLEIKTVDDKTLARWVAQQFQRRNCTIAPDEVAYFLSVEERNMESMLTEIDKIAAYCHGTVTRDALEKLCVKTVQARAYELNDLILEKNADRVFEVWNDLKALRTPPQMVLGSLFSCFANLYKLKECEALSESARADLTGLQPFLVRKYAKYLSEISLKRLDKLMDSCAEIDVLSKSSATDADLLVVRLLSEALEVL